MMRKNYTRPNLFFKFYFPIIVTIFFCYHSFGQTIVKENDFTIKSEIIEIENSKIREIEISWDYSAYSNKAQSKLEIEIQPLNGCWNGLDGTIRSEKVTKPIKDFSQNPIGKLYLSLAEYNAKCFKWRAKTTNTTNGSISFTDWQFASFL